MSQQTRPPVITVMGHVDHGKTSLLDYIRKTKIAARESGGITQHIGAYQIEFKGKKMTFIDTPGHAAFNKMRERGAQITDIVVLVVAVDDGVKPQTLESIRHIQTSKVPVIVAINKSDLPNVYPDMVKAQLAEQGILVQGYGGSVDAISLSAKTGMGVDELLETIQITAELQNLTGDATAPLKAVVIESTKDAQRGPVASVIVQQGTLSLRQELVVDDVKGRVRRLSDENGKMLADVTPGSPAEIIGLESVPAVGSIIHDAMADYTEEVQKSDEDIVAEVKETQANDFSSLFDDKPRLKLIIRADVEGTLEAILNNLDEDSIELIDYGVGEITESDVEYAETSGATILAFRVKIPKRVKELAKNNGVKLRAYDIIYQLIEDLQKQMLRLMEPTIDEVIVGEAEIIQIFEMRGDKIAGCRMKSGEIKKHDRLHLKREDVILFNPVIKTMMHAKEEITEIKGKNEFGVVFKNKKSDFRVGDTLIAYTIKDEDI